MHLCAFLITLFEVIRCWNICLCFLFLRGSWDCSLPLSEHSHCQLDTAITWMNFPFFFFSPTFLEKNQDLLLGSKLIVSHWKKYCAPAWDNSKESKQAKHLDTHINARLYKPTTWSHLSTAFGFDHAASKAVQKKKKIAVFEKKKKKQK